MKSAELQELTASEPLTLEQEYEMQRQSRYQGLLVDGLIAEGVTSS